MGSHKDTERKKKRGSSPSLEGEGKSKRRRTAEEKSEKRKSHKHRSHKEKKSKDKHKRKHAKHDRQSKHGFEELSNDDYFSKNNEFATWLKEEKNMFFSDLSSDSARELFKDFVNAWNSQRLDARYYEGISTGPRTSHNWKIRP